MVGFSMSGEQSILGGGPKRSHGESLHDMVVMQNTVELMNPERTALLQDEEDPHELSLEMPTSPNNLRTAFETARNDFGLTIPHKILSELKRATTSTLGSSPWTAISILPGSSGIGGSWFVETWDLWTVSLVLTLAYYEPYAISLYDPGLEPWFHSIFNMVFNITFTMDMILEFFVAHHKHQEDSKELWERDVRLLAKRYVALPCTGEGHGGGWFWLDMITVIPGWATMLCFRKTSVSNPLLLLRIVRLFQTARLKRIAKVVDLAHAKFGFRIFMVEVLKFMFLTTLVCHWIACSWVLFEGKITHGYFSLKEADASWLSALIESKGDPCVPNAEEDNFCVYLMAYYWGVMTLTSVGYGDITPQNREEYLLSTIIMIVVGYVWAYIVGTIVAILSDLDPAAKSFNTSLDMLQDLMTRNSLPDQLQIKLRTYMYETRGFMQHHTQRRLVESLFSDGLQRDVAQHSLEAKTLREKVYWMKDLQDEVVLDIVRGLRPCGYGPTELINLRGNLLLFQRGIALARGRVLSRGDVWGHNDILVETPQLLDTMLPRTLSYVELLALSRNHLLEVARNYPEADRLLRKAQIRTAVARAFVYLAGKFKKKNGSAATPTRGIASLLGESMQNRAPESSFSNPGMKRLQLRKEVEDAEVSNGELRGMLEVILDRLDNLPSEAQRRQGGATSVGGIGNVLTSWKSFGLGALSPQHEGAASGGEPQYHSSAAGRVLTSTFSQAPINSNNAPNNNPNSNPNSSPSGPSNSKSSSNSATAAAAAAGVPLSSLPAGSSSVESSGQSTQGGPSPPPPQLQTPPTGSQSPRTGQEPPNSARSAGGGSTERLKAIFRGRSATPTN